jgi:hypothetical protein
MISERKAKRKPDDENQFGSHSLSNTNENENQFDFDSIGNNDIDDNVMRKRTTPSLRKMAAVHVEQVSSSASLITEVNTSNFEVSFPHVHSFPASSSVSGINVHSNSMTGEELDSFHFDLWSLPKGSFENVS